MRDDLAQPAIGATPTIARAVDPQRARQAQQTGRQLLDFVDGRVDGVPPIWDNLAAQQRATRVRDILRQRGGRSAGEPHWRVGEQDAAMQAGLRFADGREGALRAVMIWREQRWLVDGISLEAAP